MACSILIDSVTLGSAGIVTVQGRLMNPTHCGSGLPVTLNCGGATFSGTAITTPAPGQYTWVAYIETTGCSCGTSTVFVSVANTCPGEECETTFSGPLCCCPTVGTTFQYGICNTGNNTQVVTFNTSVYINNNCTIHLRRDFGDGTLGTIHSFTGPGNFNYPESHPYATPATYTSVLNVIPPSINCPAIDTTNVSVLCDSACYGGSFWAGFCRFLAWLFLTSTTVGITMLLAQLCYTSTIGLSMVLLGYIALIFFLLLRCDRCVCDPRLKYLGTILMAIGFTNLMFVLPPVPPIVPCTTWPFFVSLIISVVFLFGGWAILHYLWFKNNKEICPLNQCDFWCTLAGIVNPQSVAAVAASSIIVMLAINFTLVSNAGFALLILSIFVGYVALFGPLSNLPCRNNTPTCH